MVQEALAALTEEHCRQIAELQQQYESMLRSLHDRYMTQNARHKDVLMQLKQQRQQAAQAVASQAAAEEAAKVSMAKVLAGHQSALAALQQRYEEAQQQARHKDDDSGHHAASCHESQLRQVQELYERQVAQLQEANGKLLDSNRRMLDASAASASAGAAASAAATRDGCPCDTGDVDTSARPAPSDQSSKAASISAAKAAKHKVVIGTLKAHVRELLGQRDSLEAALQVGCTAMLCP